MSGYWYVGDADGTSFNWSKEPTFRCPLAERAAERPDELAAIADLLSIPAQKLARLITRVHHSRRRVDGKLTDECTGCGAKMVRLGYRAWIDEPIPESEWNEGNRASAAIGSRLGMGGGQRRTIRTTWHKTKKEAEAWARHECKRAKATA